MKPESVARALAAEVGGTATGSGVHWQVDVQPVGGRTVRVHCFVYEPQGGLALGMNPGNARNRGRRLPTWREGAEYLVILAEDQKLVVSGRTRVAVDAIAAIQGWMTGGTVDDLVPVAPFIDEQPRAMRTLAQHLDPRLRWDIGDEPSNELWVYADGRACSAALVDGSLTCTFTLGPAQVATGDVHDVPGASRAWLVERLSISQLAARVPEIRIEAHAEMLEIDPPQWHWRNVLDRLANPRDVLSHLKDLVAALAASPIASRFYSYTSLASLCFSASSHYPWVDDGLPVIAATGDGDYAIYDRRFDLPTAVRTIEAMLLSSGLEPFFGSARVLELPRLAAALAGSALVPALRQRGAWYELEVRVGSRRCVVSDCYVTFHDHSSEHAVTWPSIGEAARAIADFLEREVSLEAIANDPQVVQPKPHGSDDIKIRERKRPRWPDEV